MMGTKTCLKKRRQLTFSCQKVFLTAKKNTMKAMLSSKAMRNHLLTMAKRKVWPEALSFRSISSFSDVLSQSNRAQRRLSSARPLPEEEELDVGEWDQPKRGVEKRPRFQFQLAKPLRQTSLSTVPQPAVFEEENVEENMERESESPKELLHTEGVSIPITSKLHIFTPQEGPPRGTWPVFRLMVSTNAWFVWSRENSM